MDIDMRWMKLASINKELGVQVLSIGELNGILANRLITLAQFADTCNQDEERNTIEYIYLCLLWDSVGLNWSECPC